MALSAGPHLLNIAPQWQPDNSSPSCTLCASRFRVLRRHRHHCRNCGRLVCSACSSGRWEARSLPPGFNPRRERKLRVCSHCVIAMGEFKSALRAGNVARCQRLRDQGFVSVSLPLPGERGRRPVHVAALAGAVDVLAWLTETRGCSLDHTDDDLRTPLALAAGARQIEAVGMLVGKHSRTTREIVDVAVLQDVLSIALGVSPPIDVPGAGGQTSSTSGASPEFLRRQASIISVSCGDIRSSSLREFASTSASVDERGRGGGAGAGATAGAGAGAAAKKKAVAQDDDAGACLVCWDAEALHCMVPCGHLVYCTGCVPSETGPCPVCRVEATQILRVFKP